MPRRKSEFVVCAVCAPHPGHAPGKCHDPRETKPCKCKAESRAGKECGFVVYNRLSKSYFSGGVVSGFTQVRAVHVPAFGATLRKAHVFGTAAEVFGEMRTWPMMADVGCEVRPAPARAR